MNLLLVLISKSFVLSLGSAFSFPDQQLYCFGPPLTALIMLFSTTAGSRFQNSSKLELPAQQTDAVSVNPSEQLAAKERHISRRRCWRKNKSFPTSSPYQLRRMTTRQCCAHQTTLSAGGTAFLH